MNYSLSRVSHLIRRDLTLYKKQLLTYGGGLLLINLIILIIFYYRHYGGDVQPSFWQDWYWVFLFVIASGFTQSAFIEFKDSHRKQQYLNLPATTLEKYSVRWLFTMVVVPLIVTVIFMLFQKLAGGDIRAIFTSIPESYFLIFFVVMNAWIFMCSTIFNRAITGFGVSMGGAFLFLIIVTVLLLIIFNQFTNGLSLNSGSFTLNQEFYDTVAPKLKKFTTLFSLFILPPIFWLISYHKLKEQEA